MTVDRQTAASEVYRCGRLWFARGCGLYFLVRWRHPRPRWQRVLERALDVLAEAGIGGERSSGHGAFAWSAEHDVLPDLPEARAGAPALTLALYHPTRAELEGGALHRAAGYELRERTGWMASPEARNLRRKSVLMLGEGSVVWAPATVLGGLADVTPAMPLAHRVYRYGYAWPLGVPSTGGVP